MNFIISRRVVGSIDNSIRIIILQNKTFKLTYINCSGAHVSGATGGALRAIDRHLPHLLQRRRPKHVRRGPQLGRRNRRTHSHHSQNPRRSQSRSCRRCGDAQVAARERKEVAGEEGAGDEDGEGDGSGGGNLCGVLVGDAGGTTLCVRRSCEGGMLFYNFNLF